jgi:hypothetical protein
MYNKIYYTTSSVIGHSWIERTLHFRTILTVKARRLEVNVNSFTGHLATVKHFDNRFAPLVCHSKILMTKAGRNLLFSALIMIV